MLCLFCFDYISFDMSSQLWWTSLQINKWTVPGTSIAPQVRSLRKAIDMDPGSSGRLEDEDDNKGKSRIVHLLAFSSYIYTDILQFM